MLTYENARTPHRDRIPAAAVDGPRAPYRLRHPSLSAHEQAALASAVDDGLMPDEVARILAGRRVAEAFPVRWGESPAAYASRAVSEMFVAYLQ
ncbi:MAG: hypothetical protein INR63_10140 [Actinomycetospora chiangmaiensis]|jgi:hypothetical protein|nr:hypothetical protein [Actinomycetospora chiangmaiensis]